MSDDIGVSGSWEEATEAETCKLWNCNVEFYASKALLHPPVSSPRELALIVVVCDRNPTQENNKSYFCPSSLPNSFPPAKSPPAHPTDLRHRIGQLWGAFRSIATKPPRIQKT